MALERALRLQQVVADQRVARVASAAAAKTNRLQRALQRQRCETEVALQQAHDESLRIARLALATPGAAEAAELAEALRVSEAARLVVEEERLRVEEAALLGAAELTAARAELGVVRDAVGATRRRLREVETEARHSRDDASMLVAQAAAVTASERLAVRDAAQAREAARRLGRLVYGGKTGRAGMGLGDVIAIHSKRAGETAPAIPAGPRRPRTKRAPGSSNKKPFRHVVSSAACAVAASGPGRAHAASLCSHCPTGESQQWPARRQALARERKTGKRRARQARRAVCSESKAPESASGAASASVSVAKLAEAAAAAAEHAAQAACELEEALRRELLV